MNEVNDLISKAIKAEEEFDLDELEKFANKRRMEMERAMAVIDKSMTIDVSTSACGSGSTEYWEKVKRFSGDIFNTFIHVT